MTEIVMARPSPLPPLDMHSQIKTAWLGSLGGGEQWRAGGVARPVHGRGTRDAG